MRALIPLLCLAAACDAPAADPKLREELAALRREVAELRAVEQPNFDSAQAMEDLSKEVRHLRERLAQPAPPAPTPPVTLPTATIPAGGFVGGVGGTASGVNDLYWVLSKVSVDGAERLVLAQYRALPDARGFKLTGVRMLSADLQIIEYGQDRPRVKEILEELKKR
jgi:hypothetical protein